MRIFILITLLSLTLLTACSEQSPLEKLKSNTFFPELNNTFWSEIKESNPNMWAEAISFCKENKNKPNCVAVMNIYVIQNGETSAPEIGHSGNSLLIPNIK